MGKQSSCMGNADDNRYTFKKRCRNIIFGIKRKSFRILNEDFQSM